MERRLQAAYASGDADAILRCLNGDPDEAQEKPDACSANGDPRSATSSVRIAEEELNVRLKDLSVEEDGAPADEDEGLVMLKAKFPHADVAVVQSLLYAHGGDVVEAHASVEELVKAGAIGVANDDSHLAANFDSEGFAAAVAEWDTSFPSLGSSSPALRKTAPSMYDDGKLLTSLREQHLLESLPWIPRSVVLADLKKTRDATLSHTNLSRSHPKPSDWDFRKAQKIDAAIQAALQRASRSWNNENGYDDDVSKSEDPSSRWVQSGDAVSKLYASCRQRASVEARQRNKHFEMAAKKARAGNGAEAARLGSLGRAANARMKALHEEAADLLWNTKNSNSIQDGLIDCHGLHVSEAIDRLPGALDKAALAGRSSIKVVFGTGHHSKPGGGAARLRPAIIQFLQDTGYSYTEVQDRKSRLTSAVSVMLR